MHLSYRFASLLGPLLFLSACQAISGLGDLDLLGAGGTGAGGAGGAGAGGDKSVSASSSGVGGAGTGGAGTGGAGTGGAGGGVGGGIPCGAGICVEVLVSNTVTPVDMLAISPNYFVWGSADNGNGISIIQKYKRDTKKISEIGITPNYLDSLAIDATTDTAYWINNSQSPHIMKWELANDLSTPINLGITLRTLAVNAGSAYWFMPAASVLRKHDLSGGPDADAPLPGTSVPRELAFNGQTVYVHGAGASASIRAITYSGSMGTSDEVITVANNTYGLSFRGQNLYWVEVAGSRAGVNEGIPDGAHKDLANPVAQSTDITHVLATDNYVYWVYAPANCSSGGAYVSRKPRADLMSAETVIKDSLICPSNMVEEKGYIYFGAGTVLYRVKE